jgi:hypothetical protein
MWWHQTVEEERTIWAIVHIYRESQLRKAEPKERKKTSTASTRRITSKRSLVNNQVRGSLPRVLVYGTKDLRRGNESRLHRWRKMIGPGKRWRKRSTDNR